MSRAIDSDLRKKISLACKDLDGLLLLKMVKTFFKEDNDEAIADLKEIFLQARALVIKHEGLEKSKKIKKFKDRLLRVASRFPDSDISKRINVYFRDIDLINLGYRDIMSLVDNLSFLSVADQCWSVIDFCRNEIPEVMKRGQERLKGKRIVDIVASTRQTEAELLGLINSVKNTLLMIGHQNKLFNRKGELVLPVYRKPDSVDKACEMIELGALWMKWSDTEQAHHYFGGEIISQFHGEQRENFIFNHDSLVLFLLAKVADERKERACVQFLSENARFENSRNLSEKVINFLTHIDVAADTYCYGGMKLKSWLKGYGSLCGAPEKHMSTDQDLISHFQKNGLDSSEAQLFLEHVTFGKKSYDLLDCPILKIEDGQYCVLHEAAHQINPPHSVLSRFSSLDIRFDSKRKGANFEQKVNRFFLQHGYNTKAFKFKTQESEYEYDCVLLLDDFVFIFECKNRSMPNMNPISFFRYINTVEEGIVQVERQKAGLTQNPEKQNRFLGKIYPEEKMIPVLLYGQPFSVGEVGNTYLYDFSALSRFFSSSNLNAFKIMSNKTEISKVPSFSLWSGDRPTAQDLLKQLKDPFQVSSLLKSYYWKPVTIDFPSFRATLPVMQRKDIRQDEALGD